MPANAPEHPYESNSESSLHSFVVYLWKEDSGCEEGLSSWRGHITPVPDGDRHYFKDIGEIPGLIVAHLKTQE